RARKRFHLAQRCVTMKMVELTDVATNANGSVNLNDAPSMEEGPGPHGPTVTRLTFRGGHQIDVYETMQLAHLQREPVRSPGVRCNKPGRKADHPCRSARTKDGQDPFRPSLWVDFATQQPVHVGMRGLISCCRQC